MSRDTQSKPKECTRVPDQKEYKVRVNVRGIGSADYLIKANTPEEAFKQVKESLWNLTVTIEVEVQGELELVKEIIRERN